MTRRGVKADRPPAGQIGPVDRFEALTPRAKASGRVSGPPKADELSEL